jgi:hypothetical protein
MFLVHKTKPSRKSHRALGGKSICGIELIKHHEAHKWVLSKTYSHSGICEVCNLKANNKYNKIKSNDFYKSYEWRIVRYEKLRESEKKCAVCNTSNKELHVDHILPISLYPHLMLDKNNLQVLCIDCNIGKSNFLD